MDKLVTVIVPAWNAIIISEEFATKRTVTLSRCGFSPQ